VKQVAACGGQHGPTAFQPRLTLFEHRNAVRQPADFDQFTLNFSDLVTKFPEGSVNLIQDLKQVHIVFSSEKSAKKSAPRQSPSVTLIALIKVGPLAAPV